MYITSTNSGTFLKRFKTEGAKSKKTVKDEGPSNNDLATALSTCYEPALFKLYLTEDISMEVHRVNYKVLYGLFLTIITLLNNNAQRANSALLTKETRDLIENANSKGPYLGLIVPNLFEMDPLLASTDYKSSGKFIDISGRRFRFGSIGDKQVIVVMTGLGMINAGITSQVLLSNFDVEGVVHYGISGHADPKLGVGDVVIPRYWSHSGLWNWQRYGKGPEDELALEANGDYTREVGYINFAKYTVNVTSGSSYDNLLNNIWYQPEEVFTVDGVPENRKHVFWIPVDLTYYQISKTLQDIELERCFNATKCLSKTPKVYLVQRGTSANIFLDNAAYRDFIYREFNVSIVDMETASVSLVCLQQRVPFIAVRAPSGGSPNLNEANDFIALAATNSITVVVAFVKRLLEYTSSTSASY